ncbi:hypothetical protein HYDPIDRAFT_39129 [Hydnomerulius pinastri MD-312]|nr:hypothetical protein HYDPIDRAFT_39129 [Hydnomerulius pinastri MD-312]
MAANAVDDVQQVELSYHNECEGPVTVLEEAIHRMDEDNVPQRPERRLSISTLVIDLALMFAKKLAIKST